MTAITAYPLVRASADKRGSQSVRAVEKIRAQAKFDGEQDGRREPSSWVCVPYERRKSCQSGTIDDGSYWDGPRLKPQFAAQVLGQAMGTTAPTASARTAYQRPSLVLLPLLDKNV